MMSRLATDLATLLLPATFFVTGAAGVARPGKYPLGRAQAGPHDPMRRQWVPR